MRKKIHNRGPKRQPTGDIVSSAATRSTADAALPGYTPSSMDTEVEYGVRWNIPQDHGYDTDFDSYALTKSKGWYDPKRRSIITGVSLVDEYEEDEDDDEYDDYENAKHEENNGGTSGDEKLVDVVTQEEVVSRIQKVTIALFVFRLSALAFCVLAMLNINDAITEKQMGLKICAIAKVIIGVIGFFTVLADLRRATQYYISAFVVVYLVDMIYPVLEAFVELSKSNRSFVKTWCTLISDNSCFTESESSALDTAAVLSLAIVIYIMVASAVTAVLVYLMRRKKELRERLEKIRTANECMHKPDIESPKSAVGPRSGDTYYEAGTVAYIRE